MRGQKRVNALMARPSIPSQEPPAIYDCRDARFEPFRFDRSGHRPHRRRHESPAVQRFSTRTHTVLAATNKCLAQSNKSPDGGKATKKRTNRSGPQLRAPLCAVVLDAIPASQPMQRRQNYHEAKMKTVKNRG